MNKLLISTIEKELTLFLQPIVSSNNTKEIVFYEVLSRVCVDGEYLSPPVFLLNIPIANQFHLAISVLKKLEHYFKYIPDGIKLTVNINPDDLTSNTIVDLLKKHKEKIIVEILETSENFQAKIPLLREIRQENIIIALDDFGSQHSLFNYYYDQMEECSIFDIIKLDGELSLKEFTPKSKKIMRALVEYMKSNGQSIIAEHIETKEQMLKFKDIGVDYYQGYLFSKPFSADVFVHKKLLEIRKKVSQ